MVNLETNHNPEHDAANRASVTSDRPSVFERAWDRFGAVEQPGFTLPFRTVPQLRWQLEAFAAAQAEEQRVNDSGDPAETSTGGSIVSPNELLLTTKVNPKSERPVHTLDHNAMRRAGLLVPGDEVTALSEEYRILRRGILSAISPVEAEQGSADKRVILVSSPHAGEGKSFTALNLALSIASEGRNGHEPREVILIDADCQKPSVPRALGLPSGPGLLEALVDPNRDPAGDLVRTDCQGLNVLRAGNAKDDSGEALTGPRFHRMVAQLLCGKPGSVIIVDTPPALIASAAAEIAPYAGQCLLVARAGVTGQSALEDSVGLLGGCPDIKLLLNAAFFSPSGRKFGSYYGDGSGLPGRRK